MKTSCPEAPPIYAAVPCQSQDGSVAYSWVTVNSFTQLGSAAAAAAAVPSSAAAEDQTYENTSVAAAEPKYFTAETRLQISNGERRNDYANVEGLLRQAAANTNGQHDKESARKSGTLNALMKNEQFATIIEEDDEDFLPSYTFKVGCAAVHPFLQHSTHTSCQPLT